MSLWFSMWLILHFLTQKLHLQCIRLLLTRSFSTYEIIIWNRHFSFISPCIFLIGIFISYALVMGRTPFYRISIELEHHFSNIQRIPTCSFVGDRTRTPYFCLRTIEHRTSNLIELLLHLLNYPSNWLEHHFFEHRTNSNMFILW